MSRRRNARSLGESELIIRIRHWLGDVSPPPPEGIGDDCAVIGSGSKRGLVTVDSMVAGLHFSTTAPPAAVGAKLLKRNLSDIAAMGGIPRDAVVALALSGGQSETWLAAFFRGLGRCARQYGVRIVGGDCSETNGPLVATLTLFGDAPPRPLIRSNARAGDFLYVTGTLGGSILGKHLRFAPRLEEGRWLAGRRSVHAAIDLSDGLGKDAVALLRPHTRAIVDPQALPVSAAGKRYARNIRRNPTDCAINDGEDYELLFAAGSREHGRLTKAWRRRFSTRLTCIGRVESQRRATPDICFSPPLPAGIEARGHVHFR